MPFPISSLIDASELRDRWGRSRLAALRKVVGSISVEENEGLSEVTPQQKPDLLRAVFENSKKFGTSARWYFGAEWEVSDFREIVPQLGLPCFSGKWAILEEGVALERSGCESGKLSGFFACDYFKEAMAGLVLGLSDDVSFVRHTSCGYGESVCTDLFVRADAKHLLFGPLPPGIERSIELAEAALLSEGVAVEFPGQSEGVLYYKWQIVSGESCRDVSSLVRQAIQSAIDAVGVELAINDISSRSVFSQGLNSNAEVRPLSRRVLKGEKQRWNQILS